MKTAAIGCTYCWHGMGTLLNFQNRSKYDESDDIAINMTIEGHVATFHPECHPIVWIMHDDGTSSFLQPNNSHGQPPV